MKMRQISETSSEWVEFDPEAMVPSTLYELDNEERTKLARQRSGSIVYAEHQPGVSWANGVRVNEWGAVERGTRVVFSKEPASGAGVGSCAFRRYQPVAYRMDLFKAQLAYMAPKRPTIAYLTKADGPVREMVKLMQEYGWELVTSVRSMHGSYTVYMMMHRGSMGSIPKIKIQKAATKNGAQRRTPKTKSAA